MFTFILRKLRHAYIWRRILLERLTEPLHLNLIALLVAIAGNFRAKVAFDLVVRQQHAFSLLKAADYAKELGIPRITAIELPRPRDYRDHPEYYNEHDYPMQGEDELRRRLPDNCRLVIGDVSRTVQEFLRECRSSIAFVSIDVDLLLEHR